MVPTGIQILTQSLDSAQERVEERAYQQRKNLFDYDDIFKQRNIIYYERRQILKKCFGSKKYICTANKL
jgi:preprotein translocase subunit SecA